MTQTVSEVPPTSPSSPLEQAQAVEHATREQLAELVRARMRADAEAERLAQRARLPGADPAVQGIATRYRRQSDRIGRAVENKRALLRKQEARTEGLRARAAGA